MERGVRDLVQLKPPALASVDGGRDRGLGDRLVAELLKTGASKVYVTARNPDVIRAEVAADPRTQVLPLDVTDQLSVDAAAAVADDVTLLVNNAGALGFGGVLDGEWDLFERDLIP